MEAIGLSLPVIVIIVMLAMRFNKALKSVAEVVDTKVSVTAAEMKAEVVKDLAEMEINQEDVTKAQTNLAMLKSIKI
jgi:hypothetical protein